MYSNTCLTILLKNCCVTRVAYSGTGSRPGRTTKRARFFFPAGRVIDGWGGGLRNDRPTEYRSNLRALDWRTCRQRACRENTTALFAVVAFSPDKWIDQIRLSLPSSSPSLPLLSRNLFPSPLRRERRETSIAPRRRHQRFACFERIKRNFFSFLYYFFFPLLSPFFFLPLLFAINNIYY